MPPTAPTEPSALTKPTLIFFAGHLARGLPDRFRLSRAYETARALVDHHRVIQEAEQSTVIPDGAAVLSSLGALDVVVDCVTDLALGPRRLGQID